jgi:uncharacterized protein (DUF58 family)
VIGATAGLGLIVLGSLLFSPALIGVGAIVELVWLLRSVWTRHGLRGVSYERRLEATRATVGEEIGLELVVRNRKLLPLPWLSVDDHVSHGVEIADRDFEPSILPGFVALRTTWTLGWFERVTRRLRIVASRRGVYEFREVHLQVADLFSREKQVEERPLSLRYRVVPRHVPVLGLDVVSAIPGPVLASGGLVEEPTLFAGVRPYQPGDPRRRIHWKATARLGQPVSRRFDPGHDRELLIALDVQTVAGPFWLMQYEDELTEGLVTAAMSLARSLVGRGFACGLAANGYSAVPGRGVFLAPSASPAQVARIADELAGLSRWPSQPFPSLLDRLGRRLPRSTAILALTSRPARDVLPVLRRLQRTGRRVRLAAFGPNGSTGLADAGAMGIPATTARLAPDWRTAGALELVG